MKLAVVGATGMVGNEMMRVLEEREFPVDQFIPVASEKSVGKEVMFRGRQYAVGSMQSAVALRPDIALFSAGGAVSLEWAPKFKAAGTIVIDNSSAWRREPGIPLVVPEVNASILRPGDLIIANPNCSTIQLVLVLNALHKAYGLKRVIVSTYQSVTGSGARGLRQLMQERSGEKADMLYPHPIDLNVIPQGGSFDANDYTTEENKMIFESRKILGLPDLRLTCTVVRVPVTGGHSESVNIELESDFGLNALKSVIAAIPGVIIQDEPERSFYPMPNAVRGRDEVFVGRIRRDESAQHAVNLWVVADNLRKGAATNAVQIAEYLVEAGLV